MATSAIPARNRSGLPFTILGVVLAVIGFGAVVIFATVSGGARVVTTGVQRDVVVASHDIDIRTTIAPTDVTITKMSIDAVPAGAVDKIDLVKGQVAAIKILKGQAVTTNLVVNSTDLVSGAHDYLPIPSGFVVLQIPTGELQGAGGNIQSGDYIALLATVASSGGKYQNTRTIYTDIHVLKVGPVTADAAAAAGTVPGSKPATKAPTGVATSMSIVVTQCQAEFIKWFLANGTLVATLQSYHDYHPPSGNADASCPSVSSAKGVSIQDVLGRWPGLVSG